MSGIVNVFDVGQGRIAYASLLQRAAERLLRYRAFDEWPTEVKTLEAFAEAMEGEVLYAATQDDHESVILDLPNATVWAYMDIKPESNSEFAVDLFAGSRQVARQLVNRIKALVPAARAEPTGRIAVSFWYSSSRGGRKVSRSLEAPDWRESCGNYASKTRGLLEPLIRDPGAAIATGRLLLWHGRPGTGKTSALRTLARENGEAITLEYVVDPEALFGREAGYFMDVIFDDEEEVSPGTRLLVLEDCDELLSADAKERAGQGLARLLNLVDGFIGQGLDIAVLITTNEPLAAFHPAVTRPGRCGAVVEFDRFEADEAAAWLVANGREGANAGRQTLAELIAGRDPGSRPAARERIGFMTPHQARR